MIRRLPAKVRKVVAVLAVGFVFGCATPRPESPQLDVHPNVFEMVPCWLSDTAYPVVTEVNLDAVAENRNQFDRDKIRREGEWIRIDVDGRGYRRYRVLESDGSRYRIHYQSNSGGTLTTSSLIDVEIDERTVHVDGAARRTRVMRVLSFETK